MLLKKRTIKSFVRRGGRISLNQKDALQDLLPIYALPLQKEAAWDFSNFFPKSQKLIVEVGFGTGSGLLHSARTYPHYNFIGIEVYEVGISQVLLQIEREGLQNIRLAPYDAVEIFQSCLPRESLHGVQVFFPDPWPKKRHVKRRLIQKDFLASLALALSPQGFLHCATDWEDYAQQMEALLSVDKQWKALPELQQVDFLPRPPSKFEDKAKRCSRPIWDFLYQKI